MPINQVSREQLITLMVGREITNEYPKEENKIGETILEIKNLNRKGILKDITFNVKRGEVLGISGLVGAGRTELARAILGIDKIDSGEIILDHKPVKISNFRQAINLKFGLIPEDRKKQGLVQIMSVKENTCLVSLKQIIKRGIVRPKIEERLASEYCQKLRVATPSLETEAQYLSGGNQQKVVIAKWLMQKSEIIFMDEPTRGIDVGAKVEIYHLITELVKQGKTVIMISSELPEVIGMSDRILVMHEGSIRGELLRGEFSQEKILSLCV
jgi:ABC-type sugar transport system ATPase subunit